MRKICSTFLTIFFVANLSFVRSQTNVASASPNSEARVEAILSKMTLEEKIDMIGGVEEFFIRGVPRLNVSRMKMADGPLGVRNFGLATAWEDNPVFDSYYPQADTKRIVYKEGVFVGYRGYERNNTEPLFRFGHGLSYTTFAYSNLKIKYLSGDLKDDSMLIRYEVSFDVKNTGKRAGAEVAQVYVGDNESKVPRPQKELKGFVKVNLRPAETKRVSVTLDERAFSYYDTNAKKWQFEPGDFDVLVGHSSQNIELRGKLAITFSALWGTGKR